MRENPKHDRAIAEGKAPLEYLPLSVLEGDARVHKGGADKYGIRNWLKDGIRASTYIGAMLRHLTAWAEGEDSDPDSGENHLHHLRACCAVVLDADKHGRLTDDRLRCESVYDGMHGPGLTERHQQIAMGAEAERYYAQESEFRNDVSNTPLTIEEEDELDFLGMRNGGIPRC